MLKTLPFNEIEVLLSIIYANKKKNGHLFHDFCPFNWTEDECNIYIFNFFSCFNTPLKGAICNVISLLDVVVWHCMHIKTNRLPSAPSSVSKH